VTKSSSFRENNHDPLVALRHGRAHQKFALIHHLAPKMGNPGLPIFGASRPQDLALSKLTVFPDLHISAQAHFPTISPR
jgi:hypothetical protein